MFRTLRNKFDTLILCTFFKEWSNFPFPQFSPPCLDLEAVLVARALDNLGFGLALRSGPERRWTGTTNAALF